MVSKEFYSIGDVSKICNISTKALRYYEKLGIIHPDKVQEENKYRYYNRNTLLSVLLIKYYKQMGFKLDEMRKLIEEDNCTITERQFRCKIDELQQMELQINRSYVSVKSWYDLLIESQLVVENGANQVSIKYFDTEIYCYMDQEFEYDYRGTIVNVDWTKYLESIDCQITGAIICKFPSFQDKMNGICKSVTIMQKPILPFEEKYTCKIGGYMGISCYHIGSHETIGETYEKMIKWAEKYGYKCAEESIERYVTDYWTTNNLKSFVTEVIIKIYK